MTPPIMAKKALFQKVGIFQKFHCMSFCSRKCCLAPTFLHQIFSTIVSCESQDAGDSRTPTTLDETPSIYGEILQSSQNMRFHYTQKRRFLVISQQKMIFCGLTSQTTYRVSYTIRKLRSRRIFRAQGRGVYIVKIWCQSFYIMVASKYTSYLARPLIPSLLHSDWNCSSSFV